MQLPPLYGKGILVTPEMDIRPSIINLPALDHCLDSTEAICIDGSTCQLNTLPKFKKLELDETIPAEDREDLLALKTFASLDFSPMTRLP